MLTSRLHTQYRRRLVVRLSQAEAAADSVEPLAAEGVPFRLKTSPAVGSPLAIALAAFAEECGAPYGCDLQVVDSATGAVSETAPLRQPMLLVGRGENCDLQLPSGDQPERRAYLQVIGNGLFVCEMSDGDALPKLAQLTPAGMLAAGRHVRIGNLDVSFMRSDGLSDVYVEDEGASLGGDSLDSEWLYDYDEDADEDLLAPIVLELISPKGKSRRWTARRPVCVVGSGENCRIQIRDPELDQYQCSLVRTRRGLWVAHLGSGRPTKVDGRAVTVAKVLDGQEISVGPYRIVARYGIHGLPRVSPVAASLRRALAPSPSPPQEQPAAGNSVPAPHQHRPAVATNLSELGWDELPSADEIPATQIDPAPVIDVAAETPSFDELGSESVAVRFGYDLDAEPARAEASCSHDVDAMSELPVVAPIRPVPVDDGRSTALARANDAGGNVLVSQQNVGLTEEFVLQLMQQQRLLQEQSASQVQQAVGMVMSSFQTMFQQSLQQMSQQNELMTRMVGSLEKKLDASYGLPAPAPQPGPAAPNVRKSSPSIPQQQPLVAPPPPMVPDASAGPPPAESVKPEKLRETIAIVDKLLKEQQSWSKKMLRALGVSNQ